VSAIKSLPVCPTCGYRTRRGKKAILTQRQHDVFAFIDSFIQSKGYAPSHEELCAGLSLKSLATVAKHVSTLEKKGWIRKRYNCSRSLEIA
jgi:repressor LexA